MHNDQVVFTLDTQAWFKIPKTINIINQRTWLKDKDHMTISIMHKKPLTKSNPTSW